MKAKLAAAALMALCMASACLAQNAESKFYRLDFVVKDLEGGKVVNARAHSMTIETGGKASQIRTGNRVPVTSGPNQYQYIDVGVNIDCRDAKELQNSLSLYVGADISSTANEQNAPAPVVRQTKWSANVIVPLRKATTIFSSDDPSSKRQTQLELTATPIM